MNLPSLIYWSSKQSQNMLENALSTLGRVVKNEAVASGHFLPPRTLHCDVTSKSQAVVASHTLELYRVCDLFRPIKTSEVEF